MKPLLLLSINIFINLNRFWVLSNKKINEKTMKIYSNLTRKLALQLNEQTKSRMKF